MQHAAQVLSKLVLHCESVLPHCMCAVAPHVVLLQSPTVVLDRSPPGEVAGAGLARLAHTAVLQQTTSPATPAPRARQQQQLAAKLTPNAGVSKLGQPQAGMGE